MAQLTISKVEGGPEFKCQFNPTDFQISKTNNWETKPAIGTNSESLTFKGGAAQDVTLKLLFDSTDPRRKDIGTPVTDRDDYKLLKSFILVDPATQEKDHTNKGEPPRLKIQWGNYISFVAVITQFSENMLLFTPDGSILRVEVSITLKQAADNSKRGAQNPTSRSAPRRTWLVRQGDRLDLIAHKTYGDCDAWRYIAQENGLLNPQAIYAGQILRLPELTI